MSSAHVLASALVSQVSPISFLQCACRDVPKHGYGPISVCVQVGVYTDPNGCPLTPLHISAHVSVFVGRCAYRYVLIVVWDEGGVQVQTLICLFLSSSLLAVSAEHTTPTSLVSALQSQGQCLGRGRVDRRTRSSWLPK